MLATSAPTTTSKRALEYNLAAHLLDLPEPELYNANQRTAEAALAAAISDTVKIQSLSMISFNNALRTNKVGQQTKANLCDLAISKLGENQDAVILIEALKIRFAAA